MTRRDVLKTASLASLATALSGSGLFAAGASERIRVGLIGCGGRGTEAAVNCTDGLARRRHRRPRRRVPGPAGVVARAAQGRSSRPTGSPPRPRPASPASTPTRRSWPRDVDLVILAAPPVFRPQHLKAAIEAGKHVFTEKPVAVDPVGVRSVIATSELAAGKRLAIVAGTQRRHQAHYLEIMKRVQGGDIGEIVSGQCYWNMGALWVERAAQNWANRTAKKWSDMEWQIRNWLFTGWCSGDHIVEQHVHNLDVMNWAFGAHPVKCVGMGGRAARTEPQYGNIFDHFAVEYEYPNGARVLSMCRQTAGAAENVSERVVGATGLLLHGQRGRLHQGGEALRERAGVAEPLRPGAHRPDREHQGRQAPERRATGRGEHASPPSWAG